MDYAAEYGQMHANPKRFPGYAILPYVNHISRLVKACSPRAILDYGCGKGYQYLSQRVHDEWGGLLPHCYDIGVRQLATAPTRQFDAIICTDVLEHVEEADLPDFLINVLSFLHTREETSNPFVFFSVSCVPSTHKVLADGRNVHVTQKDPAWWLSLLQSVHRDDSIYSIVFETKDRRFNHSLIDRTDGRPSAWGVLIDGQPSLENPGFNFELSRELTSPSTTGQ